VTNGWGWGILNSAMPGKLKLALRSCLGLIIFAAILFVPAGSLRFWQGWVFMVLLFVPSISSFFYFYKHDPKLIERRLQTKEKISEQKRLVGLLRLLLVAAFFLPGLDYRFGWSRTYLGAVPLWLVVLSQTLVLSSLVFVLWVMKTNTFAASTVQVEARQTVISIGPYSVVRHPMYLGGIVMFLATPLALGSYVSLPVFALVIPLYIFRLLNEEKILLGELVGYPEYCSRTRSRLIPFVW
jgi:protein-S-isoprenylcysteine O-methyltransferase Ste14